MRRYPWSSRWRRWTGAARRAAEAGRRERKGGDLPDRPEPGHDPGHHRLRGPQARRRAMLAAGDQDRRRHQPAQGGPDRRPETAPTSRCFGTVADTMAATGADVSVVLRAPRPATKDAGDRGDRGADPRSAIVITEGIPVHDTAEFWGARQRRGQTGPGSSGRTARGRRLARQVQRRHHPGRHHQRGPDSGWSPSPGR